MATRLTSLVALVALLAGCGDDDDTCNLAKIESRAAAIAGEDAIACGFLEDGAEPTRCAVEQFEAGTTPYWFIRQVVSDNFGVQGYVALARPRNGVHYKLESFGTAFIEQVECSDVRIDPELGLPRCMLPRPYRYDVPHSVICQEESDPALIDFRIQ